jgi:hypothetical protein
LYFDLAHLSTFQVFDFLLLYFFLKILHICLF